MDFEIPKIKVYAKTDDVGRIIAVDSDIFLPDPTGWTQIDEGEGDRYAHAQGNYLPGPTFTDDGVPRYKWEEQQVVERTTEEIEEDRAALLPQEPSSEEKLKNRLQAAEDALLFLMDLQMGGMF